MIQDSIIQSKSRRIPNAIMCLAIIMAFVGTYSCESGEMIGDSDWVIYENQVCSYRLEYPKGWIVDSLNAMYVTFISPETARIRGSMPSDKMRDAEYMPDIVIVFYSGVEGIGAATLEEFFQKNPYVAESGKMDLGGGEAWDMVMGGDIQAYTIMAEYDQHLYQIGFTKRSSKADLTELDRHLIKSFRFIE
jgi:hypothetical protein